MWSVINLVTSSTMAGTISGAYVSWLNGIDRIHQGYIFDRNISLLSDVNLEDE